MTNTNNNGTFVPAIIYDNAETDKILLLKDHKDKTEIYMWTHKGSGKRYIDSAVD